MKCDKCSVIGFSLKELLPDGVCPRCRGKSVVKARAILRQAYQQRWNKLMGESK